MMFLSGKLPVICFDPMLAFQSHYEVFFYVKKKIPLPANV